MNFCNFAYHISLDDGKDEKCMQHHGQKPGWKRLPGKHRGRWVDNMNMGLKEIGCESVDWIHLAQHRIQWWVLVKIIMNLCVP
jgi:hypothetical protein